MWIVSIKYLSNKEDVTIIYRAKIEPTSHLRNFPPIASQISIISEFGNFLNKRIITTIKNKVIILTNITFKIDDEPQNNNIDCRLFIDILLIVSININAIDSIKLIFENFINYAKNRYPPFCLEYETFNYIL